MDDNAIPVAFDGIAQDLHQDRHPLMHTGRQCATDAPIGALVIVGAMIDGVGGEVKEPGDLGQDSLDLLDLATGVLRFTHDVDSTRDRLCPTRCPGSSMAGTVDRHGRNPTIVPGA